MEWNEIQPLKKRSISEENPAFPALAILRIYCGFTTNPLSYMNSSTSSAVQVVIFFGVNRLSGISWSILPSMTVKTVMEFLLLFSITARRGLVVMPFDLWRMVIKCAESL